MLRKALLIAIVLCFAAAHVLQAQTDAEKKRPASASAQITNPSASNSSAGKLESTERRVEKYLRNLYAWGPSYEIKVGPSKSSPVAGLLEVPVTVSKGGQSDSAIVYLSHDGNFLIRGEVSDISADPFAETKSKLHVETSASLGSPNAKVTLVEFGDLECPSCRQLDVFLRAYLPQHPEVRLVFKHFPLTDVHPWAMTAALAAQCALQQNQPAFWKMHDAIYDSQDLISPSNAWDKLIDIGAQAGMNREDLKTCMAATETSDRVKQDISEGHSLNVTGTPTSFVNGRRVGGPDGSLIDQYVSFVQ